MKIRTDFVTNSSASSFIIACKEELTREKVEGLFSVPEDHLLYELVKDITDIIFERTDKTTKEEMLEDYEEIPSKYGDIFEKQGYHFYRGFFADDRGPAEAYLCNIDLNIETEDFILIHEGGY